jgi:hypothetical protein
VHGRFELGTHSLHRRARRSGSAIVLRIQAGTILPSGSRATTGGTDLRTPLRSGIGEWRVRSDRYSEERAANTDLDGHVKPRPKMEMYHIGG